jgi:hypothetical protein
MSQKNESFVIISKRVDYLSDHGILYIPYLILSSAAIIIGGLGNLTE